MLAGLIQLSSTRDVDRNLARCSELAHDGAERGAQWILFPENAPFLGKDREKVAIAQDLDGSITAHFRALAQETECWLSVGSIPEVSPSPDHTYNTQLLISPAGDLAHVYRKMHLFDVELEGGRVIKESYSMRAGDELSTHPLTVEDESWVVGPSICYDLRFPELYRKLVALGANVLTVPSAFTLTTGRAHWHALLKARAIENQCYVLAPNQWGHHFDDRASFGQTVAYDPWGRMIGCAPEYECAVVVELNRAYVDTVRTRMPCWSHRRFHIEGEDHDA